MLSEKGQYHCEVQESLKKVGTALAGGHASSIAKAVFSHSEIREQIILKVLDVIGEESTSLCKRNPASPFRRIPIDSFETFCWGDYYNELDQKAPLLSRIVTGIVKHNDHRNKNKKGTHHIPGVCMAIAILLKERNREMCGIQSLLSLILFQSHAQKRVCIQSYYTVEPKSFTRENFHLFHPRASFLSCKFLSHYILPLVILTA